MQKEKLTIIYARVSTREQKEDGHSIIKQIDAGEQLAQRLNFKKILVLKDEGYTGKNINRPEFQKAIELIKSNEVSHFIVKDLDRLCRNQRITIDIFSLFEKHGVVLHGVNFNASMDSAHQRLVVNILTAVAQGESDIISERTIDGIKGGLLEGKYSISKIPYGFSRKDGYIIENDKTDIVRKIFYYYDVMNLSVEAITAIMRAKDQKMTSSKVSCILRNARYTGVYVYRGVAYENIFPEVIDKQTFKRVQDLMDKRFKSAKYNYHFNGKLYCSCCDNLLGKTSAIPRGKPYLYYHCVNPQCNDHHVAVSDSKLIKVLESKIIKKYKEGVSKQQLFLNKKSEQFKTLEKLHKASKLSDIEVYRLKEIIAEHFSSLVVDLRKKEVKLKKEKNKQLIEQSYSI